MADRSGYRWSRTFGVAGLALLGGLIGGALAWLLMGTSVLAPLGIGSTAAVPSAVTAAPIPTDLEARIEAVYQRNGPAVVNITNRSFMYDFYLNPIPREGTGSGFFYDDQGHIVTNYHVVENAEELQVTLADGRNLPAEIIGTDPSNDLGVIAVDLPPGEIPVVPLGDSSTLRVGQFVVAIGNPFGLERTLTVGVISSLGRIITSPNERFIGEVIQTDAPINPGNSGGPLFNLAGAVVGVNSAILSPSGANAGIGFAIPARTVRRVVPVLIEDGRYPHPSLDIQSLELTPARVRVLESAGARIPVDHGLLIVEVVPGGPADRAGLRAGSRLVRIGNLAVPVDGDIITAIDDQPITTHRDMIVYLDTQTVVGETVQVTVIRAGEELRVPVTLGELEDL